MHKWYVIQILSSNEKKVKKSLEEQIEASGMQGYIEKIILPIENVSEIRKGQQVIVEKRLWPGYLLAKMKLTEDSWSFVKNTQGVIGFLGGETPTPLTDQEVEKILTDLEEKRHKVTQKHHFQVGDTVKIVDGVFVNFSGTVTDIAFDKGRLSVLVSIFGRETQVDDLEFYQVEALSSEE